MRRILKGLVALVIATATVLLIAGFWAVRHYDVSLRFLLAKGLDSVGIENSQLEALLRPSQLYLEHAQDGQIRPAHPRILLPGLAAWDGRGLSPLMAERLALYRSTGERLEDYPSCGRNHLMNHVVCWLTTGDADEARLAVNLLSTQQLPPPAVDKFGGAGWQWALAFDLLAKFPGFTRYEQEQIAAKLRANLEAYLQILDDESASLWHGRSSFAAQAWLLAVALYGQDDSDALLARRAQAHFLQTVSALALTEAWPEGYNYWISDRALLIALAASAWVNGLERSELAPKVIQAMRRAGLWTVYATRPDNRIEALGDEGSRVDLKDETRRVIDVIAQLTRDRVFATYSRYPQKLYGRESYYRGYRWGFALFNDPSVPRLPGIPPGELVGLEAYLPRVELFGAGAMNLFVARSGWGPDDTFITLRAGHSFTHHGHYDAGHFTIFKGAPLAINSSRYSRVSSPNRLYYGVRTVAKNSILVVRPGDVIRPHDYFVKNVNDGGQRLVMPAGSRIRDVEHWRNQLGAGRHYEGGELHEYDERTGSYAYVRADLTPAYDSTGYDSQGKDGKVSSVQRELLYLFAEDRVLVRDIVVATDPSYAKKWLLHSLSRPLVDNPRVILGTTRAGVLESRTDKAHVLNGSGRLDIRRILPRDATLRLIGGEGYEFYVETDTAHNGGGWGGENFSEGGTARSWFDNGAWRLEIRPQLPRERDEFLVALSPSLGVDRSGEVAPLNLLAGNATGVATPEQLVVFTGGNRLGELSFSLPGNQRNLLLVGVVAGDSFQLVEGNKFVDYKAQRSGVIEIAVSSDSRPGDILVLRQQ
jgi:hypothetical protein